MKFISCVIVIIVFWSTLLGNNPLYISEIVEGKVNDLQTLIVYERGLIPAQHEKFVIIRIDDVQAYAWRDVTKRLVDTILANNMSVVLAVIPSRDLPNDIETKNMLVEYSRDERVEIAQHGLLHTPDEFINLTYDDAKSKIEEGRHVLVKELKIEPITFIPPYNTYSNGTEQALIEEGFTILSSGRNELEFKPNITIMGFNSESKVSSSDGLIPVTEVLAKCSDSLSERNVCVIMLHLQDYATNGVLDEKKFEKFKILLNGINEKTTTFRKMTR